jgi:hypothetical protein
MNHRLLIALVAVAVKGQMVETGFLNRTLLIDQSEYRYQVYVWAEVAAVIKTRANLAGC